MLLCSDEVRGCAAEEPGLHLRFYSCEKHLRFTCVQHTLMRASVLFPYLMLLHALYKAQDLGLFFLFVFHVDMMGRNCFLAFLAF